MASTSSQALVSQDTCSYNEMRAKLDDRSDYGTDMSSAASELVLPELSWLKKADGQVNGK
jgi:hypothetical protein